MRLTLCLISPFRYCSDTDLTLISEPGRQQLLNWDYHGVSAARTRKRTFVKLLVAGQEKEVLVPSGSAVTFYTNMGA